MSVLINKCSECPAFGYVGMYYGYVCALSGVRICNEEDKDIDHIPEYCECPLPKHKGTDLRVITASEHERYEKKKAKMVDQGVIRWGGCLPPVDDSKISKVREGSFGIDKWNQESFAVGYGFCMICWAIFIKIFGC